MPRYDVDACFTVIASRRQPVALQRPVAMHVMRRRSTARSSCGGSHARRRCHRSRDSAWRARDASRDRSGRRCPPRYCQAFGGAYLQSAFSSKCSGPSARACRKRLIAVSRLATCREAVVTRNVPSDHSRAGGASSRRPEYPTTVRSRPACYALPIATAIRRRMRANCSDETLEAVTRTRARETEAT